MEQVSFVEGVATATAPDVEVRRRWFRFLFRWSLAAAVVELMLLGLAVFWFLPASQTGPLTSEYGELGAALNDPGLYRLLGVLDVAVWIALGGLFLGLAVVLAQAAPIRAAMLLACGIGQVLGVTAAFMRLEVIGGLVSRHGDAVAMDSQRLASFLELQDVIFSLFNAGALLWAVAFALAASAAWRAAAIPRWLAGAFGLLGGVGLVDVGLYLASGDFVLDLVKFPLLAAVLIACPLGLRRPRVQARA